MITKQITLEEGAVKHLMSQDKRLAKVISTVGTIEYHIHDDPYEFIVREIVGQMLSNRVASVINNRLLSVCGGILTPEAISTLSVETMREIGLSKAKCEYIHVFTDAVIDKTVNFDVLPLMENEEIIKKLTSLRGIGRWTAKMYLIFVLEREDVLPIEDGAFLQGYRWLYKTDDVSPAVIEKRCRKWKPYSSIAARYLYRAVDMGLTKFDFHLYKQ